MGLPAATARIGPAQSMAGSVYFKISRRDAEKDDFTLAVHGFEESPSAPPRLCARYFILEPLFAKMVIVPPAV